MTRLLCWWRGWRRICKLEAVLRDGLTTKVEARFIYTDLGGLYALHPGESSVWSITVNGKPRTYLLSLRAPSGWFARQVSRAVAVRCIGNPWHVTEEWD